MTETWSCARSIIRKLRECGVDTAFGVTGGHVVPLLDACARENIRVIAFRDERSASFAAAAYGALMRRPALCLVTAGPGVTNAVTGVAQAHYANWPVISLVGCFEAGSVGRGALQELAQDQLMSTVSKWAKTLPQAERGAEFAELAYQAAMTAPRGHAHLSVPIDLVTRPVPKRLNDKPEQRPLARRAGVDELTLNAIVDRIKEAKKPLIIAGSGLWQAADDQALLRFVEQTGIPVFTHEEARGLIPDSHPLCLGSMIYKLNPAVNWLAQADLLLLVGTVIDWRVNFLQPPFVAATATQLLLTSDAHARLPSSSPYLHVVADEALTLAQVGARLGSASEQHTEWAAILKTKNLQATAVAAQQEKAAAARTSESVAPPTSTKVLSAARVANAQEQTTSSLIHPLDIAQTIETIRQAYDANIIFDGGNIGKWGKFAVTAERVGQWGRLKGGFGAIGHGLSSAIVRKLTDYDRPAVLLTGDGAFGYDVMELEVCIQENLPVVTVIAVDGAWGSVQTGLATRYLESTDSMYTRLPLTRFDQLAQALGAQGLWIDRLEDLAPALHKAIASKQTWVLAVHTQTVQSPATYATDSY